MVVLSLTDAFNHTEVVGPFSSEGEALEWFGELCELEGCPEGLAYTVVELGATAPGPQEFLAELLEATKW